MPQPTSNSITPRFLVELLDEGDERPAVVFVTAYDEHAIRAFELGALDYLRKPVALDRLKRTLERIKGAEPHPPQPSVVPEPPRPRLDKLPVESGGRTIMIDLADIRFAESQDDITYVHLYDRHYPTRFSLQEIERHGGMIASGVD